MSSLPSDITKSSKSTILHTSRDYIYEKYVRERPDTTKSTHVDSANSPTELSISSNESQQSGKSSKLSRHRSRSPTGSLDSLVPRRVMRALPDLRMHHLARKQSRDLKEKTQANHDETSPRIGCAISNLPSPLDQRVYSNPISPSDTKTPLKELGGFFKPRRKPSTSMEIKPYEKKSPPLSSTELQSAEKVLKSIREQEFLRSYTNKPVFKLDKGKLPQRPMIPPASDPIPIPMPNMRISSFKRHSSKSSDSLKDSSIGSGIDKSHDDNASEMHARFTNGRSPMRQKRPKLFTSGSFSS
jgi:hypothetical protein